MNTNNDIELEEAQKEYEDAWNKISLETGLSQSDFTTLFQKLAEMNVFENVLSEIIKTLPMFSERIVRPVIEKKLQEYLSSREITNTQPELFPVFSPQKNIELKKEFAMNFGALDRIEKEYRALLNKRLSSGLTLQEHINKVKNWFYNLRGEDLGNWLKLFAYVKAVKIYNETNNDSAVNFRAIGEGRYIFSIKQNKAFFSYFIRPDKNTGQFTTKAKTKFLKWLHENQNVIEFPIIMNGKVWNVPMRIYEYAEKVGDDNDKEILLVIDTNFLESEFKDYVSINISEIDSISDAWDTIAKDNADFKKHRLNNFVDIPLKFLLTLKTIYTRDGDYKNGNFAGNGQKLSKDRLDEHLGGLSERIQKHLISRDRIRTGKTGEQPHEIKRLILDTTFKIAIGRKWLLSMPNYDKKSNIYKFNINAGYFDTKNTAKRLQIP